MNLVRIKIEGKVWSTPPLLSHILGDGEGAIEGERKREGGRGQGLQRQSTRACRSRRLGAV